MTVVKHRVTGASVPQGGGRPVALPPGYRLTVYLADVRGLGYRQIADLTGVSVGTVKSSLHRGRGQIRARLGTLSPSARQAP